MADKAEIALTFVNLVEGRLDPKQWADWLAANEAQVMPLLNPGQAMRFRLAANATPASVNGAPLRRLAAVQVQAIAVLKAWGIEATLRVGVAIAFGFASWQTKRGVVQKGDGASRIAG